MRASVRALLDGVIDYAGLFPPAQLPLTQAVRNFADYVTGPDAWMLGRFVCPIGRVDEAARLLRERNLPPRFSVLPQTDANQADFLHKLRADLSQLPAGTWDTWEIRLPQDVLADAGALRAFHQAADDALDALGATSIYYEATANSAAAPLIGQLRALSGPGKRARIGFKLRTGGLEAAAFPPPERIAEVLFACRETGLPLKFTAGLHHPLRRFDTGVGTHMYGIINIFAAALLVHTRAPDAEAVRQILLEEDPSQFAFTDTEFGWRDQRIDVETVRELRRYKVISIGSCSFDEPRDELRVLGLLTSPV
jgi:hypothetical protein